MNSPLVQGRGQVLSRHHIEQQSSTKVIEQIFSKKKEKKGSIRIF